MKKDAMRQPLIITIFLIVFLISTIVVKHLYFPVLQGQSAFYFLSVFWICGILICVFTLNLAWRYFFRPKKAGNDDIKVDWANRRNTFRIVYPAFIRPVLVVEKVDNNPRRPLEFPVMDLSQGGSCFLDDGSLGVMESFSGHIRFNNGDRINVAGKLIRKIGDQVSVQFQHAIDWSTLLNEQRRVLAQMKSA
jgi:hypothetical protein